MRLCSVSASSSTQRCPINIKVVDVSALLIEGYRPDEIAEAAGTDVLKLDMQGAELVIIKIPWNRHRMPWSLRQWSSLFHSVRVNRCSRKSIRRFVGKASYCISCSPTALPTSQNSAYWCVTENVAATWRHAISIASRGQRLETSHMTHLAAFASLGFAVEMQLDIGIGKNFGPAMYGIAKQVFHLRIGEALGRTER